MKEYLKRIHTLEDAAKSSGYNTAQIITAFRKIYYDSTTASKNYAGSAIGGGTWNILIPGANASPAIWSRLAAERQYVAMHKEVSVGGKPVDMGHVFCGLDADNHFSVIALAHLIKMSSNKEAVTFVGDLGSVVVEYLHGASGSFYNVARIKNIIELVRFYDGPNGFISDADMAGNADAYAIDIKTGESIYGAFSRYYMGGYYTSRYSQFRRKINADKTGIHTYLTNEVMNVALAYAASKPKYRQDVVTVTSEPEFGAKFSIFGIDIGSPTWWEAYFNISGWTVELFLKRIASKSY
ncbi:hypothetical protein [Hahella sp. HN01]|uniref:hypothetical protein n=1 Tax=Hahella sp. HN01 TaxID=2847262 RepID=UPI001C1EEA76|nr:hypothetical protein [Hahella sp. HN01]MBU6952587.1 hypothetical protein [Hahella sp. HN01]